MAHALRLAARGLGNVWPNPAVGCVIVAPDGRILGRGWTQAGGRPHAETVALAQAGAEARGATAYVTLEPCAHHGRTPPCAEALAAAGIARVVSACTDPDPRVSGRGHATLRNAGIVVTEGVLGPEAARLNEGFLRRILTGSPHVTLKLALSLDGRIANAAGVSKWVTGPAARTRVHALRATHDAVMVGIGTAIADDPDLTVRDIGIARQPVRIVLDSSARLPAEGRLARSARQVPVWLMHADTAAIPPALAAAGVEALACPADRGGRIIMAEALARLAARGLTRIFCEGGGAVAAALLAGQHTGEIIAFSAGRTFGAGGTPALGPLPAAPALGPPDYALDRTEVLGPDLMHVWRPCPPDARRPDPRFILA
ncbi:MAG TPA: bifunctional diaminohydroxyphosphoribosylaminopyrimidine deaminase/5-amino-6-(5-phosphoribosylamino)uracil reductase RibD [Paracoccaceae bacterium]|nr:bifunctional diaminohydroxyphosphoribosylaminopyrimidine deaminase/5-amino-6-(5-phosphoribosylamino)uracil reductase RibD [Paracoccaceae bacterium]